MKITEEYLQELDFSKSVNNGVVIFGKKFHYHYLEIRVYE